MNIESLRKFCLNLPAATEDVKWGHDLCFNIGGKMFLVTAPDSIPVSASFKADEETFNELAEREGFKPAPYLARHKWIFVDDVSRLSKKEGETFIRQSYELVKAKLSKKKK